MDQMHADLSTKPLRHIGYTDMSNIPDLFSIFRLNGHSKAAARSLNGAEPL
jgi:hypothetical protein